MYIPMVVCGAVVTDVGWYWLRYRCLLWRCTIIYCIFKPKFYAPCTITDLQLLPLINGLLRSVRRSFSLRWTACTWRYEIIQISVDWSNSRWIYCVMELAVFYYCSPGQMVGIKCFWKIPVRTEFCLKCCWLASTFVLRFTDICSDGSTDVVGDNWSGHVEFDNIYIFFWLWSFPSYVVFSFLVYSSFPFLFILSCAWFGFWLGFEFCFRLLKDYTLYYCF